MKCDFCGGDTKCIDSREPIQTDTVRRRRECLSCGKRFTTFELRDTLISKEMPSFLTPHMKKVNRLEEK